MKSFFLLRGAPASGKTTWCEENELVPYAVRSDAWKIKISGYTTDEDGRLIVSHENLEYVWECIRDDLFDRMERGDRIVILDSNNRRTEEMNQYVQKTSELGYVCYLVDFYNHVTRKECLKRNIERDPLRFCPEWAIHRFYDELEMYEIPDAYTIITPQEAVHKIKEILSESNHE